METWTADDCERLARDILSDQPTRLSHVQAVARAARLLSAATPGDDLLVSAAWLHDIGYAHDASDTGMHAIDGAVVLDSLGAPRQLVSLVAFHTGAEYEADERGLSDRLEQFDRPPQDDLDALILVDLVSGPTGQRTTVSARIDEMLTRYEPQHPVHRAVTRSRGYLEECAARAAKRFDYPM